MKFHGSIWFLLSKSFFIILIAFFPSASFCSFSDDAFSDSSFSYWSYRVSANLNHSVEV